MNSYSKIVARIELLNDNLETSSHGSGIIIINKSVVITNFHLFFNYCDGYNTKFKVFIENILIEDSKILDISPQLDIVIIGIELKNVSEKNKIREYDDSLFDENIVAAGYSENFKLLTQTCKCKNIVESIPGKFWGSGNSSLLQFEGDIEPGFSGGGLFDGNGFLIGIITSRSSQNKKLNYAIPIEKVLAYYDSYSNQNNFSNNIDTLNSFFYYFESKNYKKALEDLEKCLEHSDDDGLKLLLWKYKILTLLHLRMIKEAKNTHNKVMEYVDDVICDSENINFSERKIFIELLSEGFEEIYYLFASYYLEKSEFDIAISYLKLGLNYKSVSSKLYFIYSTILFKTRQFESSLGYINKAINLENDNIHYHKLKALCLFELGKFDESVEICSMIESLTKDKSEYSHVEITGDVCLAQNKIELAVHYYTEALKILDNTLEIENELENDTSLLNFNKFCIENKRCFCLIKKRNYLVLDKISTVFLLRDNENLEIIYYYKALALFGLNEFKTALDYINKSLSKLEHADSFLLRALIYFSQDNFEKCYEDLCRVKKINPEKPDLLKIKKIVELRLEEGKNQTKVISTHNKLRSDLLADIEIVNIDSTLLQLFIRSPQDYYTAAHSCFIQSKFELSLFQINKAIKFDSENIVYLRLRSETYYALNQSENGFSDIEHVLKIEPSLKKTIYRSHLSLKKLLNPLFLVKFLKNLFS